MGAVFYLVRHGETEFNRDGLVQGWCNAPLTEAGVDAARRLGCGLARAGIEFTAAYSSDLGRAVQTRDELLRAAAGEDPALSRPRWVEEDPRLREWCYGNLEAGPGENMRAEFREGFGREMPFEELNRRLPEVANVIQAADASGKAEGWDAIERRLRAFFRDAAARLEAAGGGTALAVSHSFAIRTVVYLIDPTRVNDPLRIANASVTEVFADGAGNLALGEIGSTRYLG